MASAHEVGPPSDGRAARAHRTRQAVIEAILALIEEGDLRPTAPRIANRAGVSLRSVFQHFDDMEALIAEASDVALGRVSHLIEPVRTDGPVGDRVVAWVVQRSRVYEALRQVRRAAARQAPFSPALAGVQERTQRWSEHQLAAAFALELDRLTAPGRREVLACIAAATSPEVWEQLRHGTGLGVPAARRALVRITTALLLHAVSERGPMSEGGQRAVAANT